jgi:hypothetical protein
MSSNVWWRVVHIGAELQGALKRNSITRHCRPFPPFLNVSYEVTGLRNHACSILDKRKWFVSPPQIPALLWGPPSPPPVQWVWALLWGKGLRFEFDRSPSSRGKLKKKWMCTSTPRMCFHGVDRHYFTVTVVFRGPVAQSV